jgi:hypothetical protein
VPEITPEVLKDSPVGSAPAATLKDGAGKPEAVHVKL